MTRPPPGNPRPRRRRAAASGLALGLASCAVVTSCGEDPPPPPPDSGGTFPDLPTLRLDLPQNNACIEVASAGQVTVKVTVTHAELRDKGQCGQTPQCGHLQLLVDGTERQRWYSATTTTDLSTLSPGSHTLMVELRGDDAKVLSGKDGITLRVTAAITIAASCQDAGVEDASDASDGGEDAPADLPQDVPKDDGSPDVGSDATDAGGGSDAADAGDALDLPVDLPADLPVDLPGDLPLG